MEQLDPVVWVVEDDPIMAEIVQSCLQSVGCRVHLCQSLSDIRTATYNHAPPDLIVSELNVRDGSALEECVKLKVDGGWLSSIVAITATPKHEMLQYVFELGANDYIQKPFVIQELVARVRLHLNATRSLQGLYSVLEQLNYGVVLINGFQEVQFANRLAVSMLGDCQPKGERVDQWLKDHSDLTERLHWAGEYMRDQRYQFAIKLKLKRESKYLKIELSPTQTHSGSRVLTIENQSELVRLRTQLQNDVGLIGISPEMIKVKAQLSQLADLGWNVLIEGETGVGKELVANALHKQSRHCDQPFIAVNCAGLTESLLSAELFGYEKGAFTGADQARKGVFEQAQGGTLFLDEIGDMPFSMQGSLLRIIQEKKCTSLGGNRLITVNARLVFASHKNLKDEVRSGKFREDLYYRINSASMNVPSLRQRSSDIPLLLDTFLLDFSSELGNQTPEIEKNAMQYLKLQSWPGNVRQLQQLARSLLLRGKRILEKRDCEDLYQQLSTDLVSPDSGYSSKESLNQHLREKEITKIQQAIEDAGGDKKLAAQRLGISRATLYRKLKL